MVVGVIDVDCKVENGFDQVDVEWLTRLAELIGRGCDWVTPAAGGDGGGGGEGCGDDDLTVRTRDF